MASMYVMPANAFLESYNITSISFSIMSKTEIINTLVQFYNNNSFLIGILGKMFCIPSAVYGVYAFVRDCRYKKVELTVGSFEIRRKDLDAQNVTNVVSAMFYDGGRVPDDIRCEIIKATMPKVKKIQKI